MDETLTPAPRAPRRGRRTNAERAAALLPSPGPAPVVTVVDRGDPASFDVDTIIAKRLSGEPFGARQTTVPLRDPKRWATMEANSLADRNMHYRMVHEYGWRPVTADDLAPGITPESIGWRVGAGGILCRGPQEDQKLYKQPLDVRTRIAKAKADANMRDMGSAAKVKAAIAEQIGSQLGSEAGDFAHSQISVTGSDRQGAL